MNEFSLRRGLITSCLATLMALAPGVTATAEEILSDTQRAAVEALIERYIQENPDHILDSVRQYREREETRIAAEQQSNLSNLKREIQFDPAAPVAGNSEGSVTVVEFFDYRCGYCK
ncbi:MAG: DsbA family protein, partial [Alphaproteobacteria bacterium]|nr:DsbA family protein [Alphaproteobacteria bacterium]